MSLVVALVATVATACAAIHHPRPLPEPPNSIALTHEFGEWVVGIREPEARYTEPEDQNPDALDEVRDAVGLIAALRRTALFHEVGFTRQLACTPDLELVVVARRGERTQPVLYWLWPVTLSMAIIEDDEGVAFYPADAEESSLEFAYPTTFVIGALPLLASPILITRLVPTWSTFSRGPLDANLTRFLLSNADRLRPFARVHPEC